MPEEFETVKQVGTENGRVRVVLQPFTYQNAKIGALMPKQEDE